MRRAAACLAALLAFAAPATAEHLTVAISSREVKIDSNFTGATITVFGVIERDAATVSRPSGYQVAVLVLGPPETVVARRKDRFLGIWANGGSETIVGVPSFYALDTTGPLAELSVEAALRRLNLGFANMGFAFDGRPGVNDPAADEFRAAYLRLKQEGQLYAERIGGVAFIGDSVFRSELSLPANVPLGRYTIAVLLFSGSVLLARAEETMEVSKSGFEQFMTTASRSHALPYGLAMVTLALFTGWLAGVIFRRD